MGDSVNISIKTSGKIFNQLYEQLICWNNALLKLNMTIAVVLHCQSLWSFEVFTKHFCDTKSFLCTLGQCTIGKRIKII